MLMIHVNRDRQNLGRFTPEDVAEGLRSGRFLPTDLAWREGMETWQPLATFTDLPEPDDIVPPTLAPGSEDLPPAGLPLVTEGEPFPWDRRAEIGLFTALWETLSRTLGHPGTLFSRLAPNPGIAAPYAFYLILAVPAAALYAAESAAFIKYMIDVLSASPEAAKDPEIMRMLTLLKGTGISSFLFLLAVVVPGLPFAAAGCYQLLLMLLGANQPSFPKTFAVTSYVFGAISPFLILPCCGIPVLVIWSAISLSFGLAAAHATPTWRATLVVVLALLLCCGAYLALNLIGAGSIGAAIPQ